MTEQLTRIEHHTVNPDAYDIPTEGSPLSRWRETRKALHFHLEMAGKNIAYIRPPQGELRRIADYTYTVTPIFQTEGEAGYDTSLFGHRT